jgi:hypothetical protein
MEFATFFNPNVLKYSSLPICTTYMYYQSSTFLYDSCEVFLKITSTNLNCYSSAGIVVWKSIRGKKIDTFLTLFLKKIWNLGFLLVPWCQLLLKWWSQKRFKRSKLHETPLYNTNPTFHHHHHHFCMTFSTTFWHSIVVVVVWCLHLQGYNIYVQV